MCRTWCLIPQSDKSGLAIWSLHFQACLVPGRGSSGSQRRCGSDEPAFSFPLPSLRTGPQNTLRKCPFPREPTGVIPLLPSTWKDDVELVLEKIAWSSLGLLSNWHAGLAVTSSLQFSCRAWLFFYILIFQSDFFSPACQSVLCPSDCILEGKNWTFHSKYVEMGDISFWRTHLKCKTFGVKFGLFQIWGQGLYLCLACNVWRWVTHCIKNNSRKVIKKLFHLGSCVVCAVAYIYSFMIFL